MTDTEQAVEAARAELRTARAQLYGRRLGPGGARTHERARTFPRSRTLRWLLSGPGAAASIAFVVMLLSPRPAAVYGALQRLPLPAMARFVLAQIAALRGAKR